MKLKKKGRLWISEKGDVSLLVDLPKSIAIEADTDVRPKVVIERRGNKISVHFRIRRAKR